MDGEEIMREIGPMKKIKLQVVNDGGQVLNKVSSIEVFEFIFGIMPEGLTPFEMTLSGKKEGDHFTIEMPEEEKRLYFGHLFPVLFNNAHLSNFSGITRLKVKILSVLDADNREIVKSLAQSLKSCECGGICGCS
jgi:hypothetical protein